MEKKINYLARDFEDVRSELETFAKKYYPEVAAEYNDSSIGSLLLDMNAAVADDLSYHVDRIFQNTNINSTTSKNSLMNIARANGLKVPGRKASTCEVKISCVLPVDSTNISQPNWQYAPKIRMGTAVTAGSIAFELLEDVDFAQQFNSNAYSNRTFVPKRNSNGAIVGYTVTKSVLAVNGVTRIYKKVIDSSSLEPFMEVILPETNVMGVDSIIFKESSNYSLSPEPYEYFIPKEEYQINGEDVITRRYFEVEALVDQYRFGSFARVNDDNVIADKYNPEIYIEYHRTNDGTSDVTRIYPGAWQPIRQKYITEYTDNGYMKIIFGSGNNYNKESVSPDANDPSMFAKNMMSGLINNDMLGVLPEAGWTMFIRYMVGGGSSTNIAPGAINGIALGKVEFSDTIDSNLELQTSVKSEVLRTVTVTNTSTAVAGKDAPSDEELKYLIKYNTGAQNRAVTVKDYKVKLMQMPPRYGAPFRSQVIETNNKIEMSLLGLDANGKLDSALPQHLVENIIDYMGYYKNINDYIEIKSGKIYHLGFAIDVFIDKNYTTANVVSNIISTVQEYFDVNNHDMGDDIFMGDLEKEITLLDGVLSLINVSVYSIWNGAYSTDECPLPSLDETDNTCNTTTNIFKTPTGAESKEIDLMSIDKILYGDYNSMFEILYPDVDIQVRVKLK